MSRVIVVTGAAGYLGQHLISYLYNNMVDIGHFVALDIRKVNLPSEIPCTSYEYDIRNDFTTILEENNVTDIIHLAWMLKPVHNDKKAYSVDIEGTKNVLQVAYDAKVDYLLHASSTLAYGAHPDNPYPLRESDPLRGNKNFHYPYNKALAEKIIQEFQQTNSDCIKIGIIRPSAILSYELKNYVAEILRGGWRTFFMMPYPNKDTQIQFLHLKDALSGFKFVLENQSEGSFNLTPDTDVTVGEIPKILNGKGFYAPLGILRALLWLQWKLHLSEAPPGYLDFVAYPFVASNEKIKELGYAPEFSTIDALRTLKQKKSLS
jgi:UDP-glucose 4-epimerase